MWRGFIINRNVAHPGFDPESPHMIPGRARSHQMRNVLREEKGFTLVELSIVLVIIGLLIGGILAAQSMISTAKVNAVAMQIGQFDAGVENFKTKYNYLPGDAPSFGGNGDGVITTYGVSGGQGMQVNILDCEMANFWNNIDPQTYSFSACVSTGVAAVTKGTGKNVPEAKIGKNGSFFIASALTNHSYSADTSNPKNFYALLDSSQTSICAGTYHCIFPTTSSNSSVKPADLLALDKKIDDGIANMGNVLSGSINNSAVHSGGIDSSPIATCNDPAHLDTYLVQNNTYECTPLIRIGASANDPQ